MTNHHRSESTQTWTWFKVWFGAAAVMIVLMILTKPELQTIGLCFFAWCGGVLSTLMVQEQSKRREAKEDAR